MRDVLREIESLNYGYCLICRLVCISNSSGFYVHVCLMKSKIISNYLLILTIFFNNIKLIIPFSPVFTIR